MAHYLSEVMIKLNIQTLCFSFTHIVLPINIITCERSEVMNCNPKHINISSHSKVLLPIAVNHAKLEHINFTGGNGYKF